MKKYFISGLIGFGISVLCIVPPIIHFVTGPLGPVIGGFIGGMRTRAKLSGAIAIGLTMGICLGLFVLLIGSIIMSFQLSLPGMMTHFVTTDSLTVLSLLKFSLVPFSIAALLGTLGAYIGGRMINKSEE